jgi:GAF domain-containing protein
MRRYANSPVGVRDLPRSHAMSEDTLREITQRLLAATGASRTTVRLEGDGSFPIVAEAVAHGVPSLRGTVVPNMTAAGTFKFLERERVILVQRDLEDADPAPPPALIQAYGARAQMLAPILDGERLIGIVSVHQSGGPRDWTVADVDALELAAADVTQAVQED